MPNADREVISALLSIVVLAYFVMLGVEGGRYDGRLLAAPMPVAVHCLGCALSIAGFLVVSEAMRLNAFAATYVAHARFEGYHGGYTYSETKSGKYFTVTTDVL